jgi:hypothetical protein
MSTRHILPQGSSEPTNCTQEKYCSITVASQPQQESERQAGSAHLAQSQQRIVCPMGSYCVNGSWIPEPCHVWSSNQSEVGRGMYNLWCWSLLWWNWHHCMASQPQQESERLAGSAHLAQSLHSRLCPMGSYCVNGCWISEISVGMYNYYCNETGTTGLSTPTGEWEVGWFCPPGSVSPQQVVCPMGSYCVNGSWIPEPCPIATYGHQTNLRSVEGCTICDAGHYCNETGAVTVSGVCEAG